MSQLVCSYVKSSLKWPFIGYFIQENFSELLIRTSHYLDSGDGKGRKSNKNKPTNQPSTHALKEFTISTMGFPVRECTKKD